MSINVTGTDFGGGLDRWAIAQTTLLARQRKSQDKEHIHQRLGDLLYGLDLDIEELRNYRARLVQALTQVDSLEGSVKLAPLDNALITRQQMLVKTGGTVWSPIRVTNKLVEVAPVQRLIEHRLAKAVSRQFSLDPMSAPRSFHSVGIVVASGSDGVQQGSDRVELSGWGMEIMSKKDYPKVAKLRLPPRFPSHAEIVKFRAS